jgi:hypothetical protein
MWTQPSWCKMMSWVQYNYASDLNRCHRKVILKTLLSPEYSMFQPLESSWRPFATSGAIWSRDDLSYILLKALRVLHRHARSSLFAVSFFDVQKGPKMTTFSASIPLFHTIYLFQSIFQIFLTSGITWIRCTSLCSFTWGIVSKLSFSTSFTRPKLDLKKRRKFDFVPKWSRVWPLWGQKWMQSNGSHTIRIPFRRATFDWVHMWIFYEQWHSSRFILSRYKLHWFCYSNLLPSKTTLFANNLGISSKKRLI